MTAAGVLDPASGEPGDWTPPRYFNMMFKTYVGPVEDEASLAYLRPETAQGIFVNFKNVLDATSRKLPFGIAQIGKAFRNEITPRNFIFRVREFEQMEIEYFVRPGEDEYWHRYWVEERLKWWQEMGLSRENLVPYQQPPEELAHYAKATVDILYRFPHGLEEPRASPTARTLTWGATPRTRRPWGSPPGSSGTSTPPSASPTATPRRGSGSSPT